MICKVFSPAVAALLAAAALSHFTASAEDLPAITIRKSDKVTVSLGSLTGWSAADIKTLQNDLALSGYFTISSGGSASYTITGKSAGGGFSGAVRGPDGDTALSREYRGGGRTAVHRFADDIVQTITGNPGICSSKIAFVAKRSGHKEIFVCDADGANVTQLTRDASISVGPCISPDASQVAYTGYRSGYADIYLIELGSGARNRIVKAPGTNTGAAFSPDGDRLAATLSKDGNPELYVMSASGGGARRLTRTAGSESSPSWSPDGSELVYSSDESGRSQLYRISSGGGRGSLISTGQGNCTEPNWSPDGKKIAFNSRSGSFQVGIHTLGGGTRVLGEGQDPVWGADSRHLLFSNGDSLILLDAQTGQRTTLVSGLGQISEPSWSR